MLGTPQDYAHTVHGGPEAAAAAGCVTPPPEQMPEHRDFKLFNTYCGQLRKLLAADDVEQVGLISRCLVRWSAHILTPRSSTVMPQFPSLRALSTPQTHAGYAAERRNSEHSLLARCAQAGSRTQQRLIQLVGAMRALLPKAVRHAPCPSNPKLAELQVCCVDRTWRPSA